LLTPGSTSLVRLEGGGIVIDFSPGRTFGLSSASRLDRWGDLFRDTQ
jgi:hypothetical protein